GDLALFDVGHGDGRGRRREGGLRLMATDGQQRGTEDNSGSFIQMTHFDLRYSGLIRHSLRPRTVATAAPSWRRVISAAFPRPCWRTQRRPSAIGRQLSETEHRGARRERRVRPLLRSARRSQRERNVAGNQRRREGTKRKDRVMRTSTVSMSLIL